MRYLNLLISLVLCLYFVAPAIADQRSDPREQCISDTLDLWRDGSFDKMYDRLSHRGAMTRENFVSQMKELQLRPSCCHQKLRDFRLISDKRTTAKVYSRIGFEGVAASGDTRSRDFTLDHEEGVWKMRLADIKSLAGLSKKKKTASSKVKKYY